MPKSVLSDANDDPAATGPLEPLTELSAQNRPSADPGLPAVRRPGVPGGVLSGMS